MKWVSKGFSSHIHSYALFFHSMHAGFLWIYAVWINLENNTSPPPPPRTYSILLNFPVFLLRPSVILAERVGLNFLKTAKYVLLKLSTHAHHASLIWKKRILFEFLIRSQGVIQNFYLGGGSTNKCDHGCDQAFTKSSWGSV